MPGDEAAPLEHLNHVVDRRSGDEEVPLNVGLRRRPAEAIDVLPDEEEVLELALRGLKLGGPARRTGRCRRYGS